MATTTNGIATEQEAKTKLLLNYTPYNYSANRAITYNRLNRYFEGYTTSTYSADLCVKYSDILKYTPIPENLWYMHDDLATPYTIISQSEPSLNYRLDANTEGFSGHTCQYSPLTYNILYTRYYEYDFLGSGWSPTSSWNPSFRSIWDGKLITVSNGYLFDKNGSRYQYCTFSNSNENAASSVFIGGLGHGSSLSFDTDLLLITGTGAHGACIDYLGKNFIPFLVFYGQSDTNVYAQMKEGQLFTLIYRCPDNPITHDVCFSLLILLAADAYASLYYGPVIEVNDVDISPWGVCILSDGTVLLESSGANAETLFIINRLDILQNNGEYIITLTFQKGQSNYDLYYLSQFALNLVDLSTGELQIITFDYARYDDDVNPAVPLWNNIGQLALDTTALYQLNLTDPSDIYLDLSLLNGDYKLGKVGCCIINPYPTATTEFDYTNGLLINELKLIYTRAPLDVDLNSGTSADTTSFIGDAVLKNDLPDLLPEQELWFVFKCAADYMVNVLGDLGYSTQSVCYFGENSDSTHGTYYLYGFPESILFDKHLSRLPDISTVTPTAIKIEIPWFGEIIEALLNAEFEDIESTDLSLEFYIYYKTYYYHYKILV